MEGSSVLVAPLKEFAGWVPRELQRLSIYRGSGTENGVWLDEGFKLLLTPELIASFIGISGDNQAAHTVSFNGGPPVAHGVLLFVLVTNVPAYQRLVAEQEDSNIEIRHTGGSYEFTAAACIGERVSIELCAHTWDMRQFICSVEVGWRALREDGKCAAHGVMKILVAKNRSRKS